MTVLTFDMSLGALVTQGRTLAVLVVTVLLVAILLEREMVRGKSLSSAASARVLLAIALPLMVVWLTVAAQRALVFLSR